MWVKEIDEDLELEDIVSMFELFQYYTLFNSIKYRAKNGNKHYPVNRRADGRKVIQKEDSLVVRLCLRVLQVAHRVRIRSRSNLVI